MIELEGDMDRREADDALLTRRFRKSARGTGSSSRPALKLENRLLDDVVRMRGVGVCGRDIELIEGRLLRQALREPENLGSLSRSSRSGVDALLAARVNDYRQARSVTYGVATRTLDSPNFAMRCRIAWTSTRSRLKPIPTSTVVQELRG